MKIPNSLKNSVGSLALVGSLAAPISALAQNTKQVVNGITSTKITIGSDGPKTDDGRTANGAVEIGFKSNGDDFLGRASYDMFTKRREGTRIDNIQLDISKQFFKSNTNIGRIVAKGGVGFGISGPVGGADLQKIVHKGLGVGVHPLSYTTSGYSATPIVLGQLDWNKDLNKFSENITPYLTGSLYGQYALLNHGGTSKVGLRAGAGIRYSINNRFLEDISIEGGINPEYTNWLKSSATKELLNNTSSAYGKIMMTTPQGFGVFGEVILGQNNGNRKELSGRGGLTKKF